ncbi:prolyl oligopeptidase family serine peptidase [uncultured Vagococcus sp.]|uniref:prolyl oligopeptidase family serine peptidase n=1 Tax=uncultured Vagococcus sp. TaxID=189676 RepID=UPI0028D0E683|nr:prolyl oligopeptidase family serine peptidase [uncultured Vagococcus sp.]
MIEVYDRVIDGIPLLEVVDSALKDEKLPTVVFYHGWTNVKESVLVHGFEIAKKGFRTLLPEALYHGARNDGIPLTDERLLDFWTIIQESVDEYPVLMDYYIKAGLTDPNRLGVTGLSMGGITTCALLATYPEIKVGDCLMGSPDAVGFTQQVLAEAEKQGMVLPDDINEQLQELEALSLAENPEKIAGRPVHFWHGTKDETVPYAPTFDFYQRIQDEEFAKQVSFSTTEDGHKVPYTISQETASFFRNNL